MNDELKELIYEIQYGIETGKERESQIERLNNIINELEEYLNKEKDKLNVIQIENLSELHRIIRLEALNNILDKLKELKEK